MWSIRVSLWSLVGLAAVLAGRSFAAGPGTGPAENKPHAALRVDVNLALLPVTVMDNMGRNVIGLRRENFRVLDGSESQPIVSFNRQDAPVSVGLVFDCSRSMTDKFRVSREAPAQLFSQLNPEDETFLITVSDRAVLRSDFTSSFEEVQNSLLFTRTNGTTSLLDGVYMGLQKLKHAHNPRKALVIVSDGGDNNSRYNMHELAALAEEADTQIFTICLSSNPLTEEEVRGPELLEKLSSITGGIRFMNPDVNQMHDSMARIGITLHNQYVLGIVPPAAALQGKYRHVKVQLIVPEGTPRMQIFSRSSYYVP